MHAKYTKNDAKTKYVCLFFINVLSSCWKSMTIYDTVSALIINVVARRDTIKCYFHYYENNGITK